MEKNKGNTREHEYILENKFIKNLVDNHGYEYISIKNIEQLEDNFRNILNEENKDVLAGKPLSDSEFNSILNKMKDKSIYDSSILLRGGLVDLERDNREKVWIKIFDKNRYCDNKFQIANQIKVKGKEYRGRFDVTILINGIPVVQVELKAAGVEIEEAFNQVLRYKREGCYDGLFRFIQVFVISNSVNTRYFSNNDGNILKSNVFYWTTPDNKRLNSLSEFSDTFFDKCSLFKMVSKYMAQSPSEKKLMVMRPYQIYATENLLHRALNTNLNGYIWHTMGSGKTLTSFKVADLLSKEENVKKVFFLVDRNDLDAKTISDFNSYHTGDSIDDIESTKHLIKKINDVNAKIIVATIQKMNYALKTKKYSKQIEHFKDEKIYFIYDECHRSQLGEMNKRIRKFFNNAQHFGFTGTPIFPSAVNNPEETTEFLFGKCLHSYLIGDAIADGNVLPYQIDYISTIKEKDIVVDELVESIDYDEAIHAEERLTLIAEDIIEKYNKKTKDRTYNAMLATSSIKMLIKYYEIFRKLDHDLKIAAIFSYQDNEDMEDKEVSNKEALAKIIKYYNDDFGTNFNILEPKKYDIDISKRFKRREIDLLIVVDKYLTGVDFVKMNTLFCDKSLRMHGLIQAFSRTTRTDKVIKNCGNIICYQTRKDVVDEAFRHFSNSDNVNVDVVIEPYELLVQKLNDQFKIVKTTNPESKSEKELETFVLEFRKLMKLVNRIESYTEFEFGNQDTLPTKQEYLNYLSQYKDIYNRVKKNPDKTSILDSIDFELEFIRRDKINYDYIFELLKDVKEFNRKEDMDTLGKLVKEIQEKSKAELIEKFIESFMSADSELSVEEQYDNFILKEQENDINEMSVKFNIPKSDVDQLINEYLFTKDKHSLYVSIFPYVKNAKAEEKGRKRLELINSLIDGLVEQIVSFITKYNNDY